MKAGNIHYLSPNDIPRSVSVFPLSGALLLPGGQMPLNIFEKRYLAMVDDALCADRLIAMVQPKKACTAKAEQSEQTLEIPELCELGCLGRITAFQECGDGRYLISLSGICRYRIVKELPEHNGYRRCEIAIVGSDLEENRTDQQIDRDALLQTFRRYLKANDLEADWDSIRQASNSTLVTALCMMSPYGPAEKQALLEAEDLKTRAETLIAITEIALARDSDEAGPGLQ